MPNPTAADPLNPVTERDQDRTAEQCVCMPVAELSGALFVHLVQQIQYPVLIRRRRVGGHVHRVAGGEEGDLG